MWTPTTREQHSRKALRYQTDLTDAEWVVIEPHLPPAHGTGRPRSWPMRVMVGMTWPGGAIRPGVVPLRTSER